MMKAMTIVLLATLAAIAALAGGLVAIKNRGRLDLALGLTAGIILGLVAFDLLPEIFNIANAQNLDPIWPMTSLVIGFLLFHVVEKLILIHGSHENDYGVHVHPYVGVAGATALIGHSFLDGASIGLAFQVNASVGTAVAIAVVGHRFADGFNTTNLMLHHKNKLANTKLVLLAASFMPILGALSTLLFSLSPTVLDLYLGFFAGFILYIGAADILPQAHSKNSSKITIGFTIVGAILMFLISRLSLN